jgi:hypothetical protein
MESVDGSRRPPRPARLEDGGEPVTVEEGKRLPNNAGARRCIREREKLYFLSFFLREIISNKANWG